MPFGSKYVWITHNGLKLRLFQALTKLLGYPLFIGDRVRAYYTMKYLNPSLDDVILDAGCGIGVYTLECASRGASVIGVDTSRERTTKGLRAVKAARLDSQISFLVADIRNLPIRDEVFDKMFCVDVLEHIRTDLKALNELYRVLKNMGMMVLHVPKKGQSYIFWRGQIDYRDFGHVREGYTFDTLNSTLEKVGFVVVCHEETFKTFGGLAWEVNYMFRNSKFALLLFPLLYAISRLDFLSKREGNCLLLSAKPTHKIEHN